MSHLIRISKNNVLKDLVSSSRLLADVFVFAVQKSFPFMEKEKILAFPEDHQLYFSDYKGNIRFFKKTEYIPASINGEYKNSRNFTISNARFITNIDKKFLEEILNIFQEDILMINVTSELLSNRESIRFNSNSEVAAFRRYSCDSIKPASVPHDWPCHIFIRKNKLDQIPFFPNNFYDFIAICKNKSLGIRSLNIGGSVLDLENKNHVLQFLINPGILKNYHHTNSGRKYTRNPLFRNFDRQHSVKLFGEILFGENVEIGNNAIVVGPAIICNNVKLSSKSVIKGAIICPDTSIPPGSRIIDGIIDSPRHFRQTFPALPQSRASGNDSDCFMEIRPVNHKSYVFNFKTWPLFTYPRLLKRIGDILFASLVLIICSPLILIISIIIKINSRGPVFFKDRRQGRYGKEFNCLKFRTMIVGAQDIQDNLRNINEVDGPQFKIVNDPRVTKLGNILRDTYLDEIPQFFNVLLGQMSLVGPRPSPKKENSFCPVWRDARLSVRPGITGLWQVCGTREHGRDFQEWIHFDIEYVRNLSFMTDVSICFKTVRKILYKLVEQFLKALEQILAPLQKFS